MHFLYFCKYREMNKPGKDQAVGVLGCMNLMEWHTPVVSTTLGLRGLVGYDSVWQSFHLAAVRLKDGIG